MRFSSCTVPSPLDFIGGLVSRALPGAGPGEATQTQTLIACGDELLPLSGAGGHSGLDLEPALQLYADPAVDDGGEPAAARRPYVASGSFSCPVWDPYTAAVYMREGSALLRLGSDDTVTVVAGDLEEEGHADGPGRTARFADLGKGVPGTIAADGAGSLYISDGGQRIRRVWLAAQQSRRPQPAGEAGAAAAVAPVEGEVLVSTLPFEAPDEITGLAVGGGASSGDGSGSGSGSGSLIFATSTALYRLPLGDPTAAPSLWVGSEGADGRADGQGASARFYAIQGIGLDGAGAVLATDWRMDDGEHAATVVRRVAADGTVTTLLSAAALPLDGLAILPNGDLAMSGEGPLRVLGLGLPLPRWHAAAPPPPPAAADGPPPRTLPADLRALLGRQPDGTADLTILVGGRTFHAYRGLLCARSDYFRQCLGGGFAEGGAQQLTLPDADSDAFELVLCFVYTDAAEIPAALAQAVAELAGRLLLPELCARAAAVVETSVSPGTVVGLLLWAEARGPAFSALLSRLKAWVVQNHEAVMREAEDVVKLLAAQSPELMAELSRDLRRWLAKRPRAS